MERDVGFTILDFRFTSSGSDAEGWLDWGVEPRMDADEHESEGAGGADEDDDEEDEGDTSPPPSSDFGVTSRPSPPSGEGEDGGASWGSRRMPRSSSILSRMAVRCS